MIQAHELMIGNYVYSPILENIIQIKVLTYSINAEPIPLTEQWLIDFGCTKIREDQLFYECRLFVCREGLFYDYGSNVLLDSVHKFQNFVFIYTGEQLTIKKQ